MQASQYELEKQWLTAEGITGVDYRFSDQVRINSGEHTGEIAEVIALISVEPEPVYVVVVPPNSPDEKSVVLPQQSLEATGSNAGRTLTMHKL